MSIQADDSFYSNFSTLLRALISFIIWVVAVSSFGSFSLSKLIRKNFKDSSKLQFGTASFLIGTLVTIILSITLMTTIGLSKNGTYIILLFLFMGGYIGRKDFLQGMSLCFLSLKNEFQKNKVLSCAILIFFGIIIISLLMNSLLPPKHIDELAYHVWNPKNGKYFLEKPVMGDSLVWGFWFPRNIETIFFFFRMLSGGFESGKIFQISLFFLATLHLTRHFYYQSRKILLAFLLGFICALAFRYLYSLAPTLLIDSGVHSLIIIGAISLLEWARCKQNILELLIAGLAMGLALGSKYVSIYYFIGFLTILFPLFLVIFIKNPKEVLRYTVVFFLPCILGSGFWFIRNLILSGNPLYPFIFSHNGFTEMEMEELRQLLTSLGVKLNFKKIYFVLFNEIKSYKSFLFLPAALTLGAFIFPKFRKHALFLFLLILSVTSLVFIDSSSMYPRYHISILNLGAIFGCYFLMGLFEQRKVWKNIGGVLLATLLIGNFLVFLRIVDPIYGVKNFLGKILIPEKYQLPSILAFEINSLNGGNKFNILNFYSDPYFSFYRSNENDITLNVKEISGDQRFDTMNDLEIINYFKKMGASYFLTDNDEIFSQRLCFRIQLEEFLRIFRIRKILVKYSEEILIKSDQNKRFYKLPEEKKLSV